MSEPAAAAAESSKRVHASSQSSDALRVVLIAIDGSEHCKRAFDHYVEQLQKQNDVLLMLHAVQPQIMRSKLTDSNEEYLQQHSELFKEQLAEVKRMKEQWTDTCNEIGIQRFSFLLVSGEPGQAIVSTAEEHSADMIVMGSRGVNTARRTFLGSVSDYVLHHAHRPVTVCPPTKKRN